jgi:alanine racemase
MYHKNESIDAHVKPTKNIYWSWNDAAASVLVSKKVVLENVILKIQLKAVRCQNSFQDEASIENAISCLMVLLYFEYDEATIQNRMELFIP